MSPQDYFEVKGKIITVLPQGVYYVKLANGHKVMAYFEKKVLTKASRLEVGDEVLLQISSYDLAQGRIII